MRRRSKRCMYNACLPAGRYIQPIEWIIQLYMADISHLLIFLKYIII
jgi:hypothetical protein